MHQARNASVEKVAQHRPANAQRRNVEVPRGHFRVVERHVLVALQAFDHGIKAHVDVDAGDEARQDIHALAQAAAGETMSGFSFTVHGDKALAPAKALALVQWANPSDDGSAALDPLPLAHLEFDFGRDDEISP